MDVQEGQQAGCGALSAMAGQQCKPHRNPAQQRTAAVAAGQRWPAFQEEGHARPQRPHPPAKATLATKATPAGGRTRPATFQQPTCWMTALSVMTWPSTSSTGSRPEGTCMWGDSQDRARDVAAKRHTASKHSGRLQLQAASMVAACAGAFGPSKVTGVCRSRPSKAIGVQARSSGANGYAGPSKPRVWCAGPVLPRLAQELRWLVAVAPHVNLH